jgi:putative tryptophan/tyrosine transport system substrate-binding protein
MRRREFITLIGGAVAAWPLAVRAQQGGRVRWIGALMGFLDDQVARELSAVFEQSLEKLGWAVGRNLSIDYRWGVRTSNWDAPRLHKSCESVRTSSWPTAAQH